MGLEEKGDEMYRLFTEHTSWLLDGCQRGAEQRGEGDIIVAHNRKLIGHSQAHFSHGSHGTYSDQIIISKQRSRVGELFGYDACSVLKEVRNRGSSSLYGRLRGYNIILWYLNPCLSSSKPTR